MNPRVKYPRVLIFDGGVGLNYFHFYSDIIHKKYLYDKWKKELGECVFLVNSFLKERKYFLDLLDLGFFDDIDLKYVEEGRFVISEEVILMKPMPYEKEYWIKTKSFVLDKLNIKPNPIKKYFINRTPRSGRNIENFDEVSNYLKKKGFEIIYFDNSSLMEQAEYMINCKELISIHGAGNTNILFLPENAKFTEISPKDRLSTHYYWLSNVLNIEYKSIIGGALGVVRIYPEPSFKISVNAFGR